VHVAWVWRRRTRRLNAQPKFTLHPAHEPAPYGDVDAVCPVVLVETIPPESHAVGEVANLITAERVVGATGSTHAALDTLQTNLDAVERTHTQRHSTRDQLADAAQAGPRVAELDRSCPPPDTPKLHLGVIGSKPPRHARDRQRDDRARRYVTCPSLTEPERGSCVRWRHDDAARLRGHRSQVLPWHVDRRVVASGDSNAVLGQLPRRSASGRLVLHGHERIVPDRERYAGVVGDGSGR
jgi:hypothetical protein